MNAAYLSLVGPRELLGKPLLDALPELRGQGFDKLLDAVVATGNPFVGREVPMKLAQHGPGDSLYVNFSYEAKRDAAGAINGVLATAFDVTEQVLARRTLEESVSWTIIDGGAIGFRGHESCGPLPDIAPAT